MIYVVNGYPRSGKTTFEDKVCQIVGDFYGYKISTIDFVKEIARQCGWNGIKDLKNRKFLSDLKDLLTEWNDVPFKKVYRQILLIKNDFEFYDLDFDKAAVFIDCREPDEIEKLCTRLGAKSILIRREGDEKYETSNESDANVLNYNYDMIIENTGTLYDLTATAVNFVEKENLHCAQDKFEINVFGDIK